MEGGANPALYVILRRQKLYRYVKSKKSKIKKRVLQVVSFWNFEF